jgi:Zn-dependent M28 family amino/carboxypeptidase
MIMLSLSSVSAAAQSFKTAPHAPARNMIWTEKMESHISFLSDTLCHGRGTGTQGGTEAAFWIARQFRDVGLIPLDRSWSQSFKTANGTTGHNIIGMVPGSLKKPSDKYIIIAAHYDHLGVLNGKAYPGADANASGTAAVVLLAEMFTAMKSVGSTFGTNIIFAGLDAKEMDMAGSAALWKSIREGRLTDPVTGRKITKDKITLMVNIDQIGSSLSPITKGREDYILMLGSQTLDAVRKNLLFSCNSTYDIGLDICLSYYGSRQFTDFFWKLSDQKIFADNGIPSVMFTSGITMNNNKLRDKVSTLNMDVLRKRIYLIYHWVETML